MLSSLQAQNLAERTKLNRILHGGMLPLNNNRCYYNMEGISSVTVVDSNPASGATPIALGIFNRCSSTQVIWAVK